MEAGQRIQAGLLEAAGLAEVLRTAEERLNGATLRQERDDPNAAPRVYLCPDILWQGVFDVVADTLQSRSWEVWAGVFMALCALANKKVWWDYFDVPLYGMAYTILVGPTTSRKSLAATICRSLLPTDYCIREGVSSGPGLLSVLTEIKVLKGEIVKPIESRPALLMVEEWTRILKYAGLEGSTLADDLNTLFHRRWSWGQNRSLGRQGGGDVVVPDPRLSILGMTTPGEFRKRITPSLIESGFINRNLILPCPRKDWLWWRTEEILAQRQHQAREKITADLIAPLTYRVWGNGAPVEHAYSPEAAERMKGWGEAFHQPRKNTENENDLSQQATARLDVYSHLIGLIYAWSQEHDHVQLEHVEAAISVVTTARYYTEELIAGLDVALPSHEQFKKSLDEKILDKVKAEPGVSRQVVQQALRRHAAFPEIGKRIAALVSAGAVEERLTTSKLKGLHLKGEPHDIDH